jgi:hypothetical protein
VKLVKKRVSFARIGRLSSKRTGFRRQMRKALK